MIRQQLVFLRDMSLTSRAKPIEVATLSWLLSNYYGRKIEDDSAHSSLSIMERLALLFECSDVKLSDRYERMFSLSTAIRDKKELGEWDVTESEAGEILACLDERNWTSTKHKVIKAVLARLSAAVVSEESDSHIDTNSLTLEHILPQKPAPGSEWESAWPDRKMCEAWVNRLGNFCLLNASKNSAASNKSFKEKKVMYYRKTIFPLALEIEKLDQWTLEECQGNHARMMELCRNRFGL